MSKATVTKPLRSTRRAAERASANFSEQLDSEDDEIQPNTHFKPLNAAKTRQRAPKRARSPASSDGTEVWLSSPHGSSTNISDSFHIPSDPVKDDNSWSLDRITDYVFVYVDTDATPYSPEKAPQGYIWWPGKIIKKSNTSIAVQPFGVLKAGIGEIGVSNPSKHNIVTFTNKYHHPRFSVSTQPPRKKIKADPPSLHDRWADAFACAFAQINDDDDGLPDVGIALSDFQPTSYTTPAPSLLDVEESRHSDGEDERHEHFEAKTIVYAHGKKNQTLYWPARIIEYVPSKKKYRVEFVDSTEELIPRSWFFADTEDGFGSCRLGSFDTQALDDPDDVDEEDPVERLPSPPPSHPSPSPEDFCSLSIREQFAYVKPVLQAILHNRYAPVKATNKAFFAGGKTRVALTKEAGIRGMMPVKDAEQLQSYLNEWCLRPKRAVIKENGASGEKPPPQTGSDEYNSLTNVEKIDYCLNILFLEAKRQILLWKEGLRTTMDLLADREEEELFFKGQQLLERTDWVRDAQRLRAAMERQLERAGKLVKKAQGPSQRALRAAARR